MGTVAIRHTMTEEAFFSLRGDNPHNNVFASAVVGLCGSFFLLSDYHCAGNITGALFLGSFIGMSDLKLLRPAFVIYSSLIAATLLVPMENYFVGFGGLLGTTALCGVGAVRLLECFGQKISQTSIR